jgi:hypothetical protein
MERYLITWKGSGDRDMRAVVRADDLKHAQFLVYGKTERVKGGSDTVSAVPLKELFAAARNRALRLVRTTGSAHVIREDLHGGYSVFERWNETIGSRDAHGTVVDVCQIGMDGNPGFHG